MKHWRHETVRKGGVELGFRWCEIIGQAGRVRG